MLLLILIQENRRRKQDKEQNRKRIREEYGEKPAPLPVRGEQVKIEKAFREDDMWLDDITWNDLDMDAVMRRIDYTRSSAGHEVLYHMLRKPMDRFYSPASTVACFCGKFERDKIIALCKHYFSSPANKSAIPALPKADFCPGVHIFDKKTEQNQIVIGFSAPSLGSDSRFACQLIASMLGGSASSRLFRRLREEQGLVYSVDACASSYLSAGVFAVSMGVSRESEKKAVLTAAEVLREFPDTVTEEELDLARDHYLSGLIMSLESNSARAARYGTGELLLGGAISEKELEEKIRGVSIDEIRSLARSFSSLSDACICAVGRTAGAKFYNKVVSGKK